MNTTVDKGRTEPFLRVPIALIRSHAFLGLSANAKALLFEFMIRWDAASRFGTVTVSSIPFGPHDVGAPRDGLAVRTFWRILQEIVAAGLIKVEEKKLGMRSRFSLGSPTKNGGKKHPRPTARKTAPVTDSTPVPKLSPVTRASHVSEVARTSDKTDANQCQNCHTKEEEKRSIPPLPPVTAATMEPPEAGESLDGGDRAHANLKGTLASLEAAIAARGITADDVAAEDAAMRESMADYERERAASNAGGAGAVLLRLRRGLPQNGDAAGYLARALGVGGELGTQHVAVQIREHGVPAVLAAISGLIAEKTPPADVLRYLRHRVRSAAAAVSPTEVAR